jgi:hypothetical protein
METALAQLTNYLPVILTAIIGLVMIGVLMSAAITYQNMEPKQRKRMVDVFIGGFVLMLIVIIVGTGLIVMRDAMRDETLIACEKQGIYYTIEDWESGSVNYTKCNITMVNGLA